MVAAVPLTFGALALAVEPLRALVNIGRGGGRRRVVNRFAQVAAIGAFVAVKSCCNYDSD